MKWFGEHIWPFKSRMRSNVIVEKDSSVYMGTNQVLSQSGGNVSLANINSIDTATATSMSTAMVSAGVSGGVLTSIVAGTGMTGSGLTGPIPTLNVAGGYGITANANDIMVTAAQTTITSVKNDSLVVGTDTTKFDWTDDGVINIYIENGEFLKFQAEGIIPATTNTVDLGSVDVEFKNAWFDGTVTSDAFAGPLTGNADTATNLTASTSTAVQLGTIELGHASDTTIARASAGDVNVEGNLMYRAGGTDVAIADGGTGANYVASVTAGTGLTSTGATSGKTIAHSLSVDATQPSIESIGTAGDALSILGDSLSMSSSSVFSPGILLENTNTTAGSSSILTFRKNAADTEDGEQLGAIYFQGEDEGNNNHTFATIIANISESDETDEAGKLTLSVAESDGTTTTLSPGLILEGEHATDGEVDVTIGAGVASVTTIAGTLTMGSTAALDNEGTIMVAGQGNITTLAGVTAIGTAGNPITVTCDNFTFGSANASDPLVNIHNTTNDASAPRLRFIKNRGVDGVDADNVGDIAFRSYDDGTPSTQDYAKIRGQIQDSDTGNEQGKLLFSVATLDGTLRNGLVVKGHESADLVDVDIARGSASTTTVAGDLDVTGTITGDVTGDVTGTSSLVTVTDNSDATFFPVVFHDESDALLDDTAGPGGTNDHPFEYHPGDGNLNVSQINGNEIRTMGNKSICYTQTSGQDKIRSLQMANNGEIVVGGSSGPAIESAADLAGTGLSATTGDGTLVLNVDATQPSIESIGTNGDTLTILSDIVSITDTDSNEPSFRLINQTDNTSGPTFIMQSQRTATPNAGQDGDQLASFQFIGYDDSGTPAPTSYAFINASISDASNGSEDGEIQLQVMSGGTPSSPGITVTGDGAPAGGANVVLGDHRDSTIKVPGKIQGIQHPYFSAITDCAIEAVPGTEYVVNDANGGAMTLPAHVVTTGPNLSSLHGARITITIGTLLTSDMTITAASANLLHGYAFMEATDAANNKTYFAPDGSDDLIITLNGGTKGGLIGDKIELIGYSEYILGQFKTQWRVRATLSHTGSAANPFS